MIIVTLTDYHIRDKNKIDRLKKSRLLNDNNILLASDYTGFDSSDIEDMIGAKPYAKLINSCYKLNAADKLDCKIILDGKVLSSTEAAISKIPDVRFDHYKPSMYLIQNPNIWVDADISDALNRFEKLFSDINAIC